MEQLLIQFPIKQDKKEIWISLLNSKIGLPYTKTMDGFISAEHGISKDKDNNNRTRAVSGATLPIHIQCLTDFSSLKYFRKFSIRLVSLF